MFYKYVDPTQLGVYAHINLDNIECVVKSPAGHFVHFIGGNKIAVSEIAYNEMQPLLHPTVYVPGGREES